MNTNKVVDALRTLVEEDGLSESPNYETLASAELSLLQYIGDAMLQGVVAPPTR